MNNQWKVVPVEPTPEMYAAASVDSREQGILGAGYKAMLAAAPVPPAGDVEVLAPIGKIFDEKYNSVVFYRGTGDQTKRYHLPGTEFVAHDTAMELVTRLTAERDGLKAENEALRNRYLNDLDLFGKCQERENHLESELTKARELLAVLVDECLRGTAVAQIFAVKTAQQYLARQPVNFIACNVDESCGQDAEGAKVNSVTSTIDPYMTAPAVKGESDE